MKNILAVSMILIVSTFSLSAKADCAKSNSKCVIPGSGSSPVSVIKRFQKLVENTIKNRAASSVVPLFKTKLNNYFNFDLMSKAALYKEWSKRSASEKAQFKALFTKMLTKNYTKKLLKKKKYNVLFKGSKTKKKKARVTIIVMKKGQSSDDGITIIYKMYKTGKSWKIYDIITDEVSLVRNYRSSFLSMIKKGGFKSVITHLKKVTK